MTETHDSVIFEKHLLNDVPATPPFLKKEMVYVIDNNGSSNYSRNQVEFETLSLSNSGKWADYSEGFISIPVVVSLTYSVAQVLTVKQLQSRIRFKQGVPLIDKVSWSYNNTPMLAERDEYPSFAAFKMNSEMSQDQLHVDGLTMGFHKETNVWVYDDSLKSERTLLPHQFYGETGRVDVMTRDIASSCGMDTVEAISDREFVYRKDVIVRLKDLPGFEKMSLTRGGSIKLTLKLNQGTAVTAYGANGKVTVSVPALKGSSNPLLIDQEGAAAVIETVSWGVCQDSGHNHEKSQCRLYVPLYQFTPEAELQMLKKKESKFTYDDYFFTKVKEQTGSFNVNLTNGIKRARGLLIVPKIAKSGNKDVTQDESMLYGPPCCPYAMKDFNVQLSGSDIYAQSQQYKYEHFMNELSGGKLGLNAGVDGVMSGLISKLDYENTHGYLYTDLSRRYDYDRDVSISISIRGTIQSLKAMDLYCYIIYEKEGVISVSTGELLS